MIGEMHPLPDPPPPWDQRPRLLTPMTGACSLLTVYLLAAISAYGALRPFVSIEAFLLSSR